jgi:hypothetical protein
MTLTFEPLVWKSKNLATVSLVPFCDQFPEYRPIVESELMEVWDSLVTIAMTGVAARAMNLLSEPTDLIELKKALDKELFAGAVGFDDYYEYTLFRTTQTGASWSGVSAMWVAQNLSLHSKANDALKNIPHPLNFINSLSLFMNVSFGSTEVGISHFLDVMVLEAEKSTGIDFGLGTKGGKKDTFKKVEILTELFEQYARKTVEMIADSIKQK